MGRALVAVAVALGVCFGLLGVLVFLDRKEDRVAVDSGLAEAISRAITMSDGGPDDLELATVADFPWDRVLIVADETPREDVSAALGFEFKGDLVYDAESRGLFVFARGDRLARFADYRGLARFEGLRRPIAEFSREEAIFRVRDAVVRPATP